MSELKISQIKQILKETQTDELPDFITRFSSDERSGVQSVVKQAANRLKKHQEELLRLEQMRLYERQYDAYSYICGIDEAGRGPLAGPVVAAAVILPKDAQILYLNDSKKLNEKKRDALFDEIKEKAVSYGIGIVSPQRIDEINILQATYEAMRDAISQLDPQPQILLNDAVTIPQVAVKQVPIVKGDAKSVSIAAASILAKVTRDRMMVEYDKEYPIYGFAGHKGYGTKDHIEAIQTHGPCPIHRNTFITHFTDEPVPTSNTQVGQETEQLAAEYLEMQGMQIIDRNFRCKDGEIDLIALDGDTLAFVEVKYRSSSSLGDPSEAVDTRKRQRVSNAADVFLYQNRDLIGYQVRFDVVSILGDDVRYIPNAFEYQGRRR